MTAVLFTVSEVKSSDKDNAFVDMICAESTLTSAMDAKTLRMIFATTIHSSLNKLKRILPARGGISGHEPDGGQNLGHHRRTARRQMQAHFRRLLSH